MTAPQPAVALPSSGRIEYANALWDRLLRQAPPDLDAALAWQIAHNLLLEQPLCQVLRPGFVTPEQLAADRRSATQVTAALIRVGDHILADSRLRQSYLGAAWDQYADLLETDCGHRQSCIYGRIDGYETADGLRYFEFNTFPVLMNFLDTAAEFFEQLGVFSAFSQEVPLAASRAMPTVFRAILSAYADWGGSGRPVMGIIVPESMLAAKSLQSARLSLCAAGAAAGHDMGFIPLPLPALSLRRGGLYFGEQRIDILLRGFMNNFPRYDRATREPLLRAVRERAVCMINSFNIYGWKTLFAAATDPSSDFGLTPEERTTLRRHLPYTRVVRDQWTTGPHGQDINLLAWALAHREQLVLKPAAEFGGKDVRLGWETPAAQWEQELQRAAHGQATHVVQERIVPITTSWPLLSPGIPSVAHVADRCPFIANGEMIGYVSRLSQTGITNVNAGGSVVPTFVLPDSLPQR